MSFRSILLCLLVKWTWLVRQLLRLAIYQIVYMDGVPESAAVNESVELAKKMGKGRAAGFINGVLRSFCGLAVKFVCRSRERGWLAFFGLFDSPAAD